MEFKPGFRFSVLDAIVLGIVLGVASLIFSYGYQYSVLVGFVVLHFFLFCNIVRMSRIPELIWASFFIGIVYLHLQLSMITFSLSLAICTLVTLVLVLLELRKPSYHGVFWKSFNPNLKEWFYANPKLKSLS